MLFVIRAHDKPGQLEVRMSNRPAHIQYLKDAGDRIKLAGPLLSGEGAGDDQGQPVGSLIVIDAASEAAVKLFAENDPYYAADVFERVDIAPFRASLGLWLPSEDA